MFGKVIDSYTMTESVHDEITVRIVYEGRAAKVLLDNAKLQEIEEYYKQCEEEGASEYAIEESKKANAQMNRILGDPSRIKAVTEDFVQHYETRVAEGSSVKGKTMFVCNSREIAQALHAEIIKIRPEWAEIKVCADGEKLTEKEKDQIKPMARVKMIMTRNKDKDKGLVVDYIGIKKAMNLALAQYGGDSEENVEDVDQSVVVIRDHLDLLNKVFSKFDKKSYFSGTPVEQLHCLNLGAEFVQVTQELERRFMHLVKRLKAAYDICCGSEKLSQDEKDHVHFYLAIRSIVFKLTKGDAPDAFQMNQKVRVMIAEALQSDGVEEIFKLGEDVDPEVDIFDDDYLAKIEKIKLPNTKIKLLQQLLAKAIGEFKKTNKAKGVDSSKKFSAVVEKYNERDEADVLKGEVLEDFTFEILNILKALAIKYEFEYPHEKLVPLPQAVKKVVDDKVRYTDWHRRDDIKTELQFEIIVLLDEHGYPPAAHDEVYHNVLEQAENFKKHRK